MRARSPSFSPHKLDVQAFIESGETLSGTADLTIWARLADNLAEGIAPADVPALSWSATGRLVPRRVGGPELWLDVSVQGAVPLTCQRCLTPVGWEIDLVRSIRFEGDEAAAAELDADLDDDVLPLSRSFDLLEALEDEVIMDSPIVPRHDQCPSDVEAFMHDDTEVTPTGEAQDAPPDERPNPFAALAALKKK